MTTSVGKNYWVVYDGASGRRYFVRFERHHPSPRWFGTIHRHAAHCFATEADAKCVVDQLRGYGRPAHVVTERPKQAPTPAPKPIMRRPPPQLSAWVDRILDTGRATGKPDRDDQINAGYRSLARQYHPDRGGTSADMQRLNDAVKWLRDNSENEVPF